MLITSLGALAGGCSRGGRVGRLERALIDDDAGDLSSALRDLSPCDASLSLEARKPCFDALARGFGSKEGFVIDPPSHAAAAAAATVVVRDHSGWMLGASATWTTVLRESRGDGADVLRLAVARALLDAKVALSGAVDAHDEATARRFLGAVASAVPGSCETYRRLADGVSDRALPPPLRADHSACVQGDLTQPGGPGAAFGSGVARATAGATESVRRTLGALRQGLERTREPARVRLERELTELETISLPPRPEADDAGAPALDFARGHIDAGVLAADAARP